MISASRGYTPNRLSYRTKSTTLCKMIRDSFGLALRMASGVTTVTVFAITGMIQEDPNSLSGATIYALFKDRSGKLWVGSDGFLDMFDPATDKFTHFSGPGTAGIEGLVLDVQPGPQGDAMGRLVPRIVPGGSHHRANCSLPA